jgi:hypothetical protein
MVALMMLAGGKVDGSRKQQPARATRAKASHAPSQGQQTLKSIPFPPPPPIANSTAPRSTLPTLSFQLPHTHNTSPPIMPQDMPPTGGYEPVQYKRNLPARGFRPATYLLMVGAVCTYGFWRVGQGIREQKYACYCFNTPSDLCTPRKH